MTVPTRLRKPLRRQPGRSTTRLVHLAGAGGGPRKIRPMSGAGSRPCAARHGPGDHKLGGPRLIGSIGASFATPEEDEQVAKAGLAALGD